MMGKTKQKNSQNFLKGKNEISPYLNFEAIGIEIDGNLPSWLYVGIKFTSTCQHFFRYFHIFMDLTSMW